MEARSLAWIFEGRNEYIIGTKLGIIRCSSVRRLDEVGFFCLQDVKEVRGTPWEPVPGRTSLHIPTNIEEDGRIVDLDGNVDGSVDVYDYKPTQDTGIDISQDIDSKDNLPEVKRRREAEPRTQEQPKEDLRFRDGSVMRKEITKACELRRS